MAKKAKAADDVPGIYRKRKPIPLKVEGRRLTAEESKAARAMFDSLGNQPPWAEWFATVGDWLAETAKSDDPNIMRDSQYARHLWAWCEDSIQADPATEKTIRNAMELGKLCERIQIRPFDEDVRTRNKQLRAIKATNVAKKLGAKSGKLKDEALAEIEQAKLGFPKRAADIDFIKTKAAEALSISKRALNNRLRG